TMSGSAVSQKTIDIDDIKAVYIQALRDIEYPSAESSLNQIARYYYNESNFDSFYVYQQKRATLGKLSHNLNLELDGLLQMSNVEAGLNKKSGAEILRDRRILISKIDTTICADSITGGIYRLMSESMKKNNQLDSSVHFNQLSTKYYYRYKDFTQVVFNKLFLAGLYKATYRYDEAVNTLMAAEGLLNLDPDLEDVV